jgi:4-hydroxybenzoate polyprenyltransferase
VVAVRPRQWPKNGLVFVGLLFSLNLTQLPLLIRCCLAFVALCLLSAGTYLVNDTLDAPRDRLHPVKCRRPIAAGQIAPRHALVGAALLLAAGLALAAALGPGFLLVGVAYLALTTAYSLWLKQYPLIDVLVLASGFVLRAAAGAVVIDVPISPWLLFCTLLGALLIALGKRRSELLVLEQNAAAHRASLTTLTVEFVDQLALLMAACSIMAYSLYTFFVHPYYPPWLMLTIPLVIYGIFRYLYLVRVLGLGGSPEELLLHDRPLLGTVVLWVVLSAVILYAGQPRP